MCEVAATKRTIIGHKCFLNTTDIRLTAEPQESWDWLNFDEQSSHIYATIQGWLNWQRDAHCGLWDKETLSTAHVNRQFTEILSDLIDHNGKFMPLETVMVSIFKRLSCYILENAELENSAQTNILGISSLLTLHRILKKQSLSSIEMKTELICEEDFEVESFCLSLKNEDFRRYTMKREKEFLHKLKTSGVSEITCQVYPQLNSQLNVLMVSAFGSVKSLEILKLILTDRNFYRLIITDGFVDLFPKSAKIIS